MSENDTGLSDGGVVVRRQDESTDPTTVRVVECVAAALGVSPMALPPLGRTVDSDALDKLFAAPDRQDCTVSFEFAGTAVTITRRGDVRVSPIGDGDSN